MIESPKPDSSQIERFTEKPYRTVNQIWGTPLLLKLDDRLHFEKITDNTVKLTVSDAEKKPPRVIDLRYSAEQLSATQNEIDLVFRLKDGDLLAFDQDHEDNGAPSNGGGTGTGNRT